MYTVLLPPSDNPIAVNKYIITSFNGDTVNFHSGVSRNFKYYL